VNRRTDACPNACTYGGAPMHVGPRTWTTDGDSARGTYRCPQCRRTWTTSYRVEIERAEFA